MDSDEHNGDHDFKVGDIVRESVLIASPDREPWVGIVMYIEKDRFELHSFIGPFEDLVAIQWLQTGYIESLPASVIRLVQRARQKTEEKP